MILPKIREIKEALTALFSAPYTTRFPSQPFEAVKEYRGIPRYHAEYCIGCGACAQVCPAKAITMQDDLKRNMRVLTVDLASCMNCGQCEEKCITIKGIQLSNEHSLFYAQRTEPQVFERVEKPLICCESCGAPIACVDHLEWIKLRLGAKAYAHPNFLLLLQTKRGEVEPGKIKEQLRREDQIKWTCARCRQMIVTIDEF
ncbi:MAG TPA: 4Fe-4S dicluster domain-containing protein [bacterium]|jgi:hydrogenase-4 component H|nr:4Fe-4S dicluster domain-containing protein [bacterium]HOX87548.1 4Fe-4S dicluster domain-containing protein [bacterium]HPG47268.1 4Fe-4S dicluster domain-containing protein [bacterium]HPM99526.1 4Fe-4S dicluster domain-containing protein [bacterium]